MATTSFFMPYSQPQSWFKPQLACLGNRSKPRQVGHRDRNGFDKETAGDKDVPAFIFTHDPPEADAKHFTNPDGKHDIKAYFHGDMNYNEFYTWKGVDGSISLPVFRVDSPMKGFDSSSDETLMSFIVVTIEPENMRLTARECLRNADRAPGIKWGATATIAY